MDKDVTVALLVVAERNKEKQEATDMSIKPELDQ